MSMQSDQFTVHREVFPRFLVAHAFISTSVEFVVTSPCKLQQMIYFELGVHFECIYIQTFDHQGTCIFMYIVYCMRYVYGKE